MRLLAQVGVHFGQPYGIQAADAGIIAEAAGQRILGPQGGMEAPLGYELMDVAQSGLDLLQLSLEFISRQKAIAALAGDQHLGAAQLPNAAGTHLLLTEVAGFAYLVG